jgi:hypothetical protein
MSDDPPDIKPVYTSDGTCGTATPALFTGPEHINVTKFFSQNCFTAHISSTLYIIAL